jgi:hypothetical protein
MTQKLTIDGPTFQQTKYSVYNQNNKVYSQSIFVNGNHEFVKKKKLDFFSLIFPSFESTTGVVFIHESFHFSI